MSANNKDKLLHIENIKAMDKNKMLKYFQMSLEERLTDLLKYIDMGKIMEDTVVFPPGREISTDTPEARYKKMLGPDLSYRGMGWSSIEPHMYGSMLSGKKRAETIIDNLKSKKTNIFHFAFKSLLEKLNRKKKKS